MKQKSLKCRPLSEKYLRFNFKIQKKTDNYFAPILPSGIKCSQTKRGCLYNNNLKQNNKIKKFYRPGENNIGAVFLQKIQFELVFL